MQNGNAIEVRDDGGDSAGQATGITGTWGLDNWQFTIDQVTAVVPEPSILWLPGAGLLGILLWRRRVR